MLNLNWRSISIVIFLFSSIASIYLFTAEYSINEISNENYSKNLYSKDNNVAQVINDLQNAIPDRISLLAAHTYIDSDNYSGNGFKVKNEKTSYGNHVSILSSNSGLGYELFFDAGILSGLYIFKSGMYTDLPNQFSESAIADIVNRLVLNNSYIFKQTDYKNGYDLLLKETSESFIIGAITNANFGNHLPHNISFSSIRKTKYMNFIR